MSRRRGPRSKQEKQTKLVVSVDEFPSKLQDIVHLSFNEFSDHQRFSVINEIILSNQLRHNLHINEVLLGHNVNILSVPLYHIFNTSSWTPNKSGPHATPLLPSQYDENTSLKRFNTSKVASRDFNKLLDLYLLPDVRKIIKIQQQFQQQQLKKRLQPQYKSGENGNDTTTPSSSPVTSHVTSTCLPLASLYQSPMYQSERTRDSLPVILRPSVDYYIVLDFECTCGRGVRDPEIIEFPALLISAYTLEVVAFFHSYVKPTESPITQFCTQLTGITQQQVNNAPTLDLVLVAFGSWLQSYSISLSLVIPRVSHLDPFDPSHASSRRQELINRYYQTTMTTLQRHYIGHILSTRDDVVQYIPEKPFPPGLEYILDQYDISTNDIFDQYYDSLQYTFSDAIDNPSTPYLSHLTQSALIITDAQSDIDNFLVPECKRKGLSKLLHEVMGTQYDSPGPSNVSYCNVRHLLDLAQHDSDTISARTTHVPVTLFNIPLELSYNMMTSPSSTAMGSSTATAATTMIDYRTQFIPLSHIAQELPPTQKKKGVRGLQAISSQIGNRHLGRPHSGLSDALNIARIIPYLVYCTDIPIAYTHSVPLPYPSS